MIDLDRLEALVDKATHGPWVGDDGVVSAEWSGAYDWSGPVDDRELVANAGEDDALFIAEARQAVPELIREVKRLSWENGHLRDKYDEDMEQLRQEHVGDMEVLLGKIQAVQDVLDRWQVQGYDVLAHAAIRLALREG